MTKGLKIALGVTFLIAGGALLLWSVESTHVALNTLTQGLPLLDLMVLAIALACLGASVDLFGWGRPTDPEPKIRNTKVYGAAEPASEWEANAAARGNTETPLRDQTFTD